MGVYVKNVDMPTDCGHCDFFSEYGGECYCYITKLHTTFIGEIADDCPLIEIVTCGECKYSKIYALQSDTPMSRWCHKGHFPKEVTDGYYCGDGERRNDDL